MDIDELLAQLRWCCSYGRLTDVSGRAAIEADGIPLSCGEAEALARGDTSLHNFVSAQTHPSLPLAERIRIRAYQHYIERGRQSGPEIDDWLQAEQEIRRAQ